MPKIAFSTTADIPVPKNICDQIIGQDGAVEIIKKAAIQRRHVVLVGAPGTGKSLLGQGLAELLPKTNLNDILTYPNELDDSQPIVSAVHSGEGLSIVETAKLQILSANKNHQFLFLGLAIIAMIIPWWVLKIYGEVMAAASLIAGVIFVGAVAISFGLNMRKTKVIEPKLIVDHSKIQKAPFYDATGAHAGALLGDVLHDPLQSGGLGTPAHLRVLAGAIHKANGGVLFIDEIATLTPRSQQELLTAMQEKRYPITGQSERSAGAMVRTQPVPCDFVLAAAGNLTNVQNMHPALRSRIRGYGYEVYMRDTMEDTPDNRLKIARFIAQEVVKDGRIPHFTKSAVDEIIFEARRRANRKGHLTLALRDLGGLVRAAGDLALEERTPIVDAKHILRAKTIVRTLEQQVADRYIEHKKAYEVIRISGKEIGRVNGLAVIGSGNVFSGVVLPIEAEVTPVGDERKKIQATGKLGQIAKEAITNVSAIIKHTFNADLKKYDVYVQFLQTFEGVEGDSASIAVATAIISALNRIPVKQNIALTGSLSIRGEVLPVGGITQKVEAAIEAGLEEVIVPKANLDDIILPKNAKIKLTPVENIAQVLKYALVWKGKEHILIKILHGKH
ncbi:MAG: ATP-dependent protease LonB [DPANN group archaeon]|nr:ATP-dependent protease LonB [DPANN group archaeon]